MFDKNGTSGKENEGMVKKSIIMFSILAMLTFGYCACWGYTVSQWPAPGIPNTVFGPGSAAPGNVGYGYPGYYGGYAGYGYPGNYGGYQGGYGQGYYGQGWIR
jgi:hypothetical protein